MFHLITQYSPFLKIAPVTFGSIVCSIGHENLSDKTELNFLLTF